MMGFETGRVVVPSTVIAEGLPEDAQKVCTTLPPPPSMTVVSSPSLSRSDSLTSIDPDMLIDDLDDLDKLSNCLSEVSSDTKTAGGTPSTSIIYDIIQAQLALWTCVGSLMYSYAWRQHRKKFIISIFFVIPTVITVCCAISGLLTTIVILSRLFSTPFAYNDFLAYANQQEEGRSSPQPMTRLRSYSGASSSHSSADDLLPKPLCRRHSSTSSVCGELPCPPVTSPPRTRKASTSTSTTSSPSVPPPSSSSSPSSALHRRRSSVISDAVFSPLSVASRPPSRKLSYCYSHFSASHEQLNDVK